MLRVALRKIAVGDRMWVKFEGADGSASWGVVSHFGLGVVTSKLECVVIKNQHCFRLLYITQ